MSGACPCRDVWAQSNMLGLGINTDNTDIPAAAIAE